MKIYRNSMRIYENQWKSTKSMNMYGIYLCRKKKMGYFLYSKNINASHICPPKRHRLFQQREWKFMFSGQHGLWPAKHGSKSHLLWKLEMIPRSLRTFCPKRFLTNPQQKLRFRQKCWSPFFRQQSELKKHENWNWLQNLGIRTASSGPSRRASMSAFIFSPKNDKIVSNSTDKKWKASQMHKIVNFNWTNEYLELGGRGGSL